MSGFQGPFGPSATPTTILPGVTPTAGGAAGQLLFDTGSFVQESSGLTWDNTNKALTIAGAVAVQNGTTASAFRAYNTWSSGGANYERGVFDWTTANNVLTIGTQTGGTGVARNLQFVIGGTSMGDYGVSNSGAWTFGNGTIGVNFVVKGSSGNFTVTDGGIMDTTRSAFYFCFFNPKTINFNNSKFVLSASGNCQLAGTASGVTFGDRVNPSNQWTTYSSSNTFRFNYNNSGDLIYLTSAGNIGVGVSSPSQLLTLASTGAVAWDNGSGTADTLLSRIGAGVIKVGTAGAGAGVVITNPTTVASLPSAATAGAGARAFVTDSLTPAFGSAVTGGGAVGVPVYSNGSAWNVG